MVGPCLQVERPFATLTAMLLPEGRRKEVTEQEEEESVTKVLAASDGPRECSGSELGELEMMAGGATGEEEGKVRQALLTGSMAPPCLTVHSWCWLMQAAQLPEWSARG